MVQRRYSRHQSPADIKCRLADSFHKVNHCFELPRSSIAHCRISNSQVSVKIKLDKFVEDYRQGRRESTVISAQTVDSLSAEDRLIWRTIRKELEDIGITVAAFEANRDFILRWLSHAVETGAFEEQYAPGSGSESLLHSPSASSDNITELRASVPDIDIPTEVHDIEHDDHKETSDQPPLSNADSEYPSILARSFPVNAGGLSIQFRLPPPRLPISAVPSVACGRCGKPNIAYELHMHCDQCNSGNYDLCLLCWRRGRGCLNWYGFGQSAMARWNRKVDTHSAELPHFLTGRRYRRVASHQPPKGQGFQALIETSSPNLELQSGFFCSNCSAFAEFDFWVCDICNDGEWVYCDSCVRGGRCCTHPLLPVGFAPLTIAASTSSVTLKSPEKTQQVIPLEIRVECDVCTYPIPTSASRFHCPQCNEGDYDMCSGCYLDLIKCGHIAEGDGPRGWRLCLKGHRMMIVGYADSSRGQRYVVFADLVGGHALNDPDSSHVPGRYPPSGGVGLHVMAQWSYWPEEGDDDELSFPKGAEIRECENINDDWFWGVYCGRKGLFPGNYGKKIGEGVHQSSQTADSLVTSKALVAAKGKGEKTGIEEKFTKWLWIGK